VRREIPAAADAVPGWGLTTLINNQLAVHGCVIGAVIREGPWLPRGGEYFLRVRLHMNVNRPGGSDVTVCSTSSLLITLTWFRLALPDGRRLRSTLRGMPP
jgi:hypothetical protein